jgi:large repetitive protein
MKFRNFLTALTAIVLSLVVHGAQAQTYQYHVYIDSDLRSTTGCTVSAGGQSFVGADYRLTATVTGSPPIVTGRSLSNCVAGNFGAGSALPAGYPVGLNNGLPLTGGNFADVIELSVLRSQLPGVEPQVRIGIGAESASGSVDVLYTADGTAGGPAMTVGNPAVIPTLGFFGALLLALALSALALRSLRKNRMLAQMLLVGAFFSAGLAAWAANFIADGQVGDWAGAAPLGMDAIGDSVPPLSGTDIVAAFGADERPSLFFRIDVVDAENRPPVAVNDSYNTLEDTLLSIAAPGVLGNDSDPDGDPISAQLVSGPSHGSLTLNANGSFSYTPTANYNGSDSFSYNAFDGQVASASPATVTIAITPVNDVPVFTAGPNQTINEDAGPQTVNPWATGISDGDPEITQNLSFNITGNTNAALFSVAPTVSPTGVLSYTPAANANGSATITLNLMDDGGTANGGVNTSAPQAFTITVNPVNDAPSFVAGPNQIVVEDAGAQVVNPWATAISAGPPDEAGQIVSFEITNNSNAALFSVAPAVSATGVLTYTPAANANGIATISVRAHDDGGTANGGIDVSATQDFTITVTAVNDVPSFVKGPDQTVLEDAGAQVINPWATAIDDGDPEVAQLLSFNITGNTNAALFSAGPTVSPTGVLSYTPAADANGVATITLNLMDDGGTANGGVDTSATQSFTITVTAVNDAPTLTASNPPAVLEDAAPVSIPAWASFNPGPADEAGQTVLGYQISAISNAGLFSAPPTVANNGTLSYTLAANANGSSTFTVRVQDSGGTANGGVDLSAPQTFTINVTAVNDVPSFTKGADQAILEDAGPQTVNPWATALSAGPADEASQTLSFNITSNTNPSLFSAAPVVSATGVLTYTPAANANGVATITLNIMDNGGTANGGVDTSATQSFTITVASVNDAPSFTKGADQSVAEDSGAQVANPWATALSTGPADEAGQTLSFNITGNSNPALFSVAPAVSPAGVLSYTPAADANGSATITLNLMDNGGTANGGVDTSATQNFVITVTAVNDAPVNTVPVAQNTGDTVPLVFNTANLNAISVVDIDAAAGILQMSFGTGAPANGTLTLANPGAVLTSLSGNGSELVVATGTLTALNTALNGPSGSLTYTPVPGTTAARIITVITNDQGNTGAPGAQIDSDNITVNVDAPPVVSSTPANGATIANNAAITVNFSESVNVIAGTTLNCGGAIAIGGDTGAAVNSLNLSYAPPLPSGNCTLTVPAASVSDVDSIDPPNNPIANYVATFTVDAAPAFVSSTPAAGDVVANTAVFSAVFSEPVNFGMGGFTLNCGAPVAVTPSGSGTSTLTFMPAAVLPDGAACTATLIAANITDADGFDPPDNLPANVVVNFTVDAAPTLVSAVPAAAAVVGTGQVISFTFDEAVNNLGTAITLNCGGPVAGTIGGSGSATLTFTPSAALTPGASCTATAVAAQIGDSDSIDPPQNPIADTVLLFSVDLPPSVQSTLPANGAINVGIANNLTVTFSEAVNFAAGAFTLECPAASPIPFTVSGSGTNTATIDPTPATLPINTLCVFTVDAAQITDVDAADPPDAGSGITSVSFTTVNDNAPSVSASTPANGATVASNTPLSITFSENVDVTAGSVTLSCGGPNLITGGTAGANVTGLTPTYTGPLPDGANCTLTVLAANVTDTDLIDPPDLMAANFVANFSVDQAPSVSSVIPGNLGANLATNTSITVNFSEAVNVAAGGVTLGCPGLVTFNAGVLPATNVSSLVLVPSAPLPEGVACNGTVVATLVTDNDAIDPPDQMVANFNWAFSTDAAPTVTSVTPAAAAVVATNQPITVNFSENVDLTASAFTLNCGAVVPFTSVPALPATGTNVVTLTPTGGLPQGANCTVTVVAAQVSDSDLNDPPNLMAADFVRNFSTDAAPAVTATTPANGASAVNPTSTITIDFSESVNFDTIPNAGNTSFDLECPAGSPVNFTVSTASPAASVVLDPLDNGIAGANCTLSVRAAGITDADGFDPPDNLPADVSASFSFGAIALDDAYTVTPHLTLAIGTASPQGGGTVANDLLGAGTITGFGFSPACTGTAPGVQLDAGPANGRLTLNADGSFSYEPPAAVVNTTRTFCYTVTGGDTANVVFTLQNTELVWFVDAAAAGGGIGTQARPFQTIAAVDAVDTANDTIHLAFNVSSYTSNGITLLANERLVGSGSGSTLDAISGITPVAGSAHPALGGSAPTITCGGVNCVTLGTGNTLRGFTIGNSGAAGTDLAGTGFGTLTVAELTLNGDGRALNLATGTMNGVFLDVDASSGNNAGISIDAVGGTWSVTAQSNIGNVSGTGVNIVNAPAGASATFIGGVVVNKSSAGSAVNLDTNNAAAVIDLGVVSLTAGNGTALRVIGSPLTLTGGTGTLVATNGPALDAVNATFAGGATLATVSSANSAGKGINLDNVSGSLVMNGGSISGPTGIGFDLNAGSGTVTYAGSITSTAANRLLEVTGRTGGVTTLSGNLAGSGATHTGINIAANSGGTVTLSGATKVLNTAANTAVTLAGNAGATINFTGGGLGITTSSGTGFSAMGGGTVSVQGAINTINASTGVGLDVANTTIAAAGLTFQRISSGAGANVGISLDTTGNLGGLTVTGTGAAASGGTISNKTGADNSTTAGIGIYLNSTRNVSLSRMQLNDFSNSGITGRNITNFTLNDSVLNGVIGDASAPTEGPINFGVSNPGGINGLTGTGLIHNTLVSGGIEHNLEFYNQSGTLNLTIDGTVAVSEGANLLSAADDVADCAIGFNSAGFGADGIQVEMQNTAAATVVINRCLFRDNKSQAVQAAANNDSSLSITISNSFIRKFAQGNEGILLSNGTNGQLTALMDAITVNNIGGTALFVGQTAGNATSSSNLNATIQNSTVNMPASATNHGILAFMTSTAGQTSQARVNITNNTVNNLSTSGAARAILVDTPDAGTQPGFNATVTNNSVSVFDNVNGVTPIVVQARQASSACSSIGGNSAAFPNGTPVGVVGVRARQANTAVHNTAFSAGCTTAPSTTVLACRNAPTTIEVLGTVGTGAIGSCALPTLP